VRVLVACEYSGVVRDAFLARGHDAVSCDLLPTDVPGPHIEGDVRAVLNDDWDLMIAHPPCTHLCSSGALHFHKKATQQAEALQFVRDLLDSPIPRVCVENPVGVLSTRLRKPDQIIHPWEFGHPESKTTCLWLKRLPPLFVTGWLVRSGARWDNQTPSGQNRLPPSPDRWKLRSATYPGIAKAMADQWG